MWPVGRSSEAARHFHSPPKRIQWAAEWVARTRPQRCSSASAASSERMVSRASFLPETLLSSTSASVNAELRTMTAEAGDLGAFADASAGTRADATPEPAVAFRTKGASCSCACCVGSACELEALTAALGARSGFGSDGDAEDAVSSAETTSPTSPSAVVRSFDAGSPDKCTQKACASAFAQCPDEGSHNAGSDNPAANNMVFATYQDCMCSCCKENKCPELTYSYFDAGSKDKCTPKACASQFYSCPDAGAHNDGTINVALYTGPKEAATLAPTAAKPSGVTVTKETTQMPTYGAALLSIFLIGLVGTVCGMFVYRRVQRERGFRWVQFDDEGRMMGDQPSKPTTTVEMNGNGGSHGHVVSPFDKV